jgi:hypothetical protein
MSQKRHRERRAFENLATEAHKSVHLLLELGSAVTEREPAAECSAQAAALMRALRRALHHWPIGGGPLDASADTAGIPVQTRACPGFLGLAPVPRKAMTNE